MNVKYPYPLKSSLIGSNINLAWCDVGSGDKTLLFIHGLSGYIPLWKFQIDTLKDKHRCIAVDLPGNGFSPSGDFPYSVFFYAETLARFIEKENLKNVILCGHSMGGHISIVIALRYPHLINRLVLIAPSGIEKFSKTEIMGMNHFMGIGQLFISNNSQIENSIKQSFYRKNENAEVIISDLKKLVKDHSVSKWNSMVSELIQSMLNEQVTEFLNQIEQKVLIIFGLKDEFIPNRLVHPFESVQSIAKSGQKLLRNSEYKLIEGAGHFVHIEKYEEVNKTIIEFLD